MLGQGPFLYSGCSQTLASACCLSIKEAQKGKQTNKQATCDTNEQKINKQTRKQHMWRCGYKRQYNVVQSAESSAQHIRVHGMALELIRDVQSLVHKCIL